MPRRFVLPKLVVATHNRGKAGEIRTMLSGFGVEIVSAADLGLPAPPETGTTFESNATIKALAATRASKLPALADNSGLSVHALGGSAGRPYRRLGRPDARRDGRHAAHPGRARPARRARHRRGAARDVPLRPGAGLAGRACRAGARHARRPHRLAAARQRRASATIPASSRSARRAPRPRCRPPRRTRSAIAAAPSPELVEACFR